MALDKTDKQILDLLQHDGKLTTKQIGERVNKAPTAVYQRVRKLEESGIIKRYTALIDGKMIGKDLMAFTTVEMDRHAHEMIEAFQTEIVKFTEVIECFHMTGSDDYLLKVMVKDMDEYQHFVVNKLAKLNCVGKVKSSFVMTAVKQDTSFAMNDQ